MLFPAFTQTIFFDDAGARWPVALFTNGSAAARGAAASAKFFARGGAGAGAGEGVPVGALLAETGGSIPYAALVEVFVAVEATRSRLEIAALLTTFFPMMVTAFAPGYVFCFFCFMMVLQLVWVKTMVPETKGRSLEQIQHDLGI